MFLRLLGPVAVTSGPDEPEHAPGRVQAAVLAHLALSRGQWVSTDDLVDRVWDIPGRSARNAIQVAVSHIRELLGAHAVQSGPAGYRLPLGIVRVDFLEAEELLEDARARAHEGRRRAAGDAAAAALALFVGEPLAGLDSEASNRLRTRAARVRAATVLLWARATIDLGRAEDVISDLEEALAVDPTDEVAGAMLVEALARAGRSPEALRVHAEIRRTLRDELGTTPSPELAAALQAVLNDDFAPVDAPPAPTSGLGLPPRQALLRGRAREAARVRALLDGGARVVTLVGPGGVGKTRLALEVAWLMAGDGASGVVVDLTQARTADTVPAVVAAALDTEPDEVSEALSTFELVVLDNAEHVRVAVCELLSVQHGPEPRRILVTSRTPLGLTGEAVIELGGLDAPDGLDALLDRIPRPPDPNDLPILNELIEGVDGHPLMIQLVAAALLWRTPQEVRTDLPAVLLGTRLTETDRPDRHTSVDSLLDWSAALLPQDALAVLGALSVARGDLDLPGALALARATHPRRTPDALLGDLVDASLVQRVRGPGPVRLRLLEAVRLWAGRSSLIPPADQSIERVHAQTVLDAVEAADSRADEGTNPIDELMRTRGADITWAATWAQQHDPDLLAARAGVVAWAWSRRNRFTEARALAESLARAPAPPATRARCGLALARIALDEAAPPQDVDRYVELARTPGADLDIRWFDRLVTLESELAAATGHLEDALTWTDSYRSTSRTGLALRHQQRASLLARLDRWPEALDECLAALGSASREMDAVNRLWSLLGAGYVAAAAAQPDLADQLLDDAEALELDVGFPLARAILTINRAWSRLARQDGAGAFELAAEALDDDTWIDPVGTVEALVCAGTALVMLGRDYAARVVAAGVRTGHAELDEMLDPFVLRHATALESRAGTAVPISVTEAVAVVLDERVRASTTSRSGGFDPVPR